MSIKNIFLKGTALVALSLLLISCQNIQQEPVSNSKPDVSVPEALYTKCTEPRSAMCTREYRPVCATKDTGVRCVPTPCPSTELVTKSNACTACADTKVFGYILGACTN